MVVGTSVAMIGVEEHSSGASLVVKENCNVCNTLAMSLKMERERNSQLENEIKTLTAKMESIQALMVTLLNTEVSFWKVQNSWVTSRWGKNQPTFIQKLSRI